MMLNNKIVMNDVNLLNPAAVTVEEDDQGFVREKGFEFVDWDG